MAGRPYKCPYCRGSQTIWKGYRPLKAGKVRLRQCTSCGRKFTSKKQIHEPAPAKPGAHEDQNSEEEEVMKHE
jgi:transcriptional regulator NrdR family protein